MSKLAQCLLAKSQLLKKREKITDRSENITKKHTTGVHMDPCCTVNIPLTDLTHLLLVVILTNVFKWDYVTKIANLSHKQAQTVNFFLTNRCGTVQGNHVSLLLKLYLKRYLWENIAIANTFL